MAKVLIVDDQQGIRLLLNEVFKKEGYDTYLAANGKEALQIFQEQDIDCTLLDMKIPGMNGLDILHKFHTLNKKLNVIMMTAFTDQQLIDEAYELGVKKYITKPFNIYEIRDAVKEVVATGQNEGV